MMEFGTQTRESRGKNQKQKILLVLFKSINQQILVKQEFSLMLKVPEKWITELVSQAWLISFRSMVH